MIADGKMAVIMGLEVSEPFDCMLWDGVPQCDEAQISSWLDRLKKLGVRQLEITNKFDNALTGVAGDGGTTGTIVNGGNKLATNRFWDMEHCDSLENHDKAPTGIEHNDDDLIANGLAALLPPGSVPAYPPPPLCNRMALSPLGEYAIREIAKRNMLFDPDHMSVYARNQAINLIEAMDYPGVLSSHSWSTPNVIPRIQRLGGIITPYAGDSTGFVDKWKKVKADRHGRQFWGIGYGADMNGLGGQGGPRGADVPNPVTYPFKSFDGGVTLKKEVAGTHVYDINTEGVAHYGLYPDWMEDLRMIGGDQIIRDMARGTEAYLQMWERAEGVPGVRCPAWAGDITPSGLSRELRLGATTRKTLYSAGQPVHRYRAWEWCARGQGKHHRGRAIMGVFDDDDRLGFIASTMERNRAGGVGRGDRVSDLDGADPIGAGLFVRPAGDGGERFVYGAEGGRVTWAGVATREISGSASDLARYVSLAGLG